MLTKNCGKTRVESDSVCEKISALKNKSRQTRKSLKPPGSSLKKKQRRKPKETEEEEAAGIHTQPQIKGVAEHAGPEGEMVCQSGQKLKSQIFAQGQAEHRIESRMECFPRGVANTPQSQSTALPRSTATLAKFRNTRTIAQWHTLPHSAHCC